MILVTGGTGFVGSHLLPRLVERGEPVRCLVRRTANISKLQRLNVELAYGDVTDYLSLRKAMVGADKVIHLVAIIRETKGATFEGVNVQGTANVVEAAKGEGTRRLMHMSALGAGPNQRYSYTFSKWKGEEVVRHSGLDFTVFRPTIMYGEGDAFITALAEIIRTSPLVPIIGPGTVLFQPIWVEDTISCLLASLDDPRMVGQTVEIGGPEQLTYEQIVDSIIAKLSLSRLKVHVPSSVMQPIAAVMEKVMPKPPVTPGMLALLEVDNITEIDSVEHRFGFKPQRLREKLDYILSSS